MDDQFLHDLRREPAPAFARRLRVSLQQRDLAEDSRAGAPRAVRWAALAASVVIVSVAFTFPSVRAGAQAFLDLFRVVSITGLAFDAARLDELEASGLDLPRMLGGQVEVLAEPGPTISFATPEDAAAAAGIPVRSPAWIPVGWERSSIEVIGEHAMRVTASTQSLEQLLDHLAIDDVSLPLGLDGETATVRVPPVVTTTYRNGDQVFRLTQSRSPEVEFPAGVDLAALAEIGLRLLGLERDEAYRFAQSIDWRTTLIVPVPAAAAAFREVDVAGGNGLLIESRQPRGSHLLLWAADERVFALGGSLRPAAMLEMAQTVQ